MGDLSELEELMHIMFVKYKSNNAKSMKRAGDIYNSGAECLDKQV